MRHVRMSAEYRPARSRQSASERTGGSHIYALYVYTGCSRKTVYILPTILRPDLELAFPQRKYIGASDIFFEPQTNEKKSFPSESQTMKLNSTISKP